MHVVFRVDASLYIGTGHVMRCLTLAETFREMGHSCMFISRAHKGNLIQLIKAKGFDCNSLEKANINQNKLNGYETWLGIPQKLDALQSKEVLFDKIVDFLVVDHYAIDYQWQSLLKNCVKKILVIDDLANRRHECDFLLDQTFGRNIQDYDKLVPKNCKCLLGSRYALLRDEFIEFREKSLKKREVAKLKKIFINMGGIDNENFTSEIIHELPKTNLSTEVNLAIVLGKHSPHIDSVVEKANQLPYPSTVIVEPPNMAKLMSDCDLAIGAAGSSSLERCSLGLPSIQIVVAENQKTISKKLNENGAVIACEIEEFKDQMNYLLKNIPTVLKKLTYNSKNLCDGFGVKRVVNNIHTAAVSNFTASKHKIKLLNYYDLTHKQSLKLLSLRNNVNVRKWMREHKIIPKNEHLQFINDLEKRLDAYYFAIFENGYVYGAFYFTKINNKSYEMGIFTNIKKSIKGMGTQTLNLAINSAQILGIRILKLNVVKENVKAIALYRKFGFYEVSQIKNSNLSYINFEKKLTI